jgi:hypothetical protein
LRLALPPHMDLRDHVNRAWKDTLDEPLELVNEFKVRFDVRFALTFDEDQALMKAE